MNVLVILVVSMFIAFLIETLVEFLVAPFFNNFPKLANFKWMQMYIAAIIGVLAAFLYKLDLINLLSVFLSQISDSSTSVLPLTIFGIVITGAAIGRGSNYLHDLVMRFFTKSALTDVIQDSPSSEDQG